MHGKKYRSVKEKVPTNAVDVAAAIAWLKEHGRSTMDETVELHVRLGVDASKSDQLVRGSVALPAGTVKRTRVAVLAGSTAEQAAAREAGAELVGGEELIKEVEAAGAIAADVVVATPAMMSKIARVARILGPQGLMPNPKTGTVNSDPAAAVKELLAGRVSFRMDSLGNIHQAVGKLSWETEKIEQNVGAVVEAVRAARPAAVKGQIVRRATLKSTMSPGVLLAL